MEKLTEERIDELLSYTEQGLLNLADDQIWKGKGTEFDPFVVENANILGQAILLKKSSLYVSFINCNFNYGRFEGCQNILLKNCTFNKLELIKCKKFKIDKSFITNLSFSKIRDIIFENTIIFNVFNKSRIKNTIFKDCQMNNDFLDYLLRKSSSGFYSKIKEIVSALIIILGLTILCRYIFMFYFLSSSEIINLLLFMGIIMVLLIFLLFSLLYEYGVRKRHPKAKILRNK